jgi:hypothetical protein
VTETYDPGTTEQTFSAIARHLFELTPTEHDTGSGGDARDLTAPARARELARTLDDESRFGRTLRPYYLDRDPYVRRIESRPLFGAIRLARDAGGGSEVSVILTDDTDRAALREAVGIARQGGREVLVFLTPTVLYEAGRLSEVADAYADYTDFETFRRDLDSRPRVSAFEVGPRDRLQAVLASQAARPRGTSP